VKRFKPISAKPASFQASEFFGSAAAICLASASAASKRFCWKSEKAWAVEAEAEEGAEVEAGCVVLAVALLASVVGCTGVTRRGRVAPDCAEASAAATKTSAAAHRTAFVLFIDGKSFIGRGLFSTRYVRTGRGHSSDARRAARVRRKTGGRAGGRRQEADGRGAQRLYLLLMPASCPCRLLSD
jgi:hypothetical protein